VRIAFVGDPASVHLERWIREFAARGHECVLFAPAGSADARMPFTAIGRAGARGPAGFLMRVLDLRRQLRRFEPDVVNAHYAHNYGTWAALAGRRPLAVTCWGSDLLGMTGRGAIERWKTRVAVRSADIVTVNSDELRRAAEELGAAPERIRKVVIGIDPRPFLGAAEEKHNSSPVVLSTRRLEPLYNVADILTACASLVLEGRALRLIVASDGSLAGALHEMAALQGASDSIEFTGFVDDEELVSLYRRASVYVSVPSSDSTAVSLLQAMAAGCAVVATDLPATREWVDPAAGNRLVSVGAPRELAEAIAGLLDAPDVCAAAGDANSRVVVERADWATQMDTMEALYERLAGGS